MIVDTNLLMYAHNSGQPGHERVSAWLTDALQGPTRVGLPWISLTSFTRIMTDPRMSSAPLTAVEAWTQVEEWLDAPAAWVPTETPDHQAVMADLMARYAPTGRLIPDIHLAALAIEHGVALASADGDFARFTELRWINPLQPE